MKSGHRLALAILLLILSAHPAASASNSTEEHPRIGLVLSGGAALGSAHVGVLKVLEELHVPIHCIAGTSMGAIVGGLYASGVSPEEMEQILATTDWRNLLDDRPNRRDLPYRRKVDDQTYLTKFEVGFNHGSIQIPSGLIAGRKLGFALQMMALQSAGIDDFDRLPIPFRAVATDLETGEAVVLSKGNLAKAMRASMSLPGIFTPVEIDGHLVVDGGLAANLPVQAALDMGADIIIAVDVGQPLPDKEGLTSIAKVTSQIIGLQIVENVKAQTALADVVIRPELEGFGSAQFERGVEMVPRGEEAALKVADELRRYAIPDDAYQARIDEIRNWKSPAGSKVSAVRLSQSTTADSRFVLRQVRTRPGDVLDFETIRQDLERLYRTGDYVRVDVQFEKTDEGYDVYFEAIDKPWGPDYVRFGLNVFADLEGESSFDVLASYTMTRVNRLRGELKVRPQIGENPAIFGEVYQPLSLDQTWFVAGRVVQSTSTEYLSIGGGAVIPYRIDRFESAADFGLQLGRYAEIRTGFNQGKITARVRDSADSDDPSTYPRRTEADLGGFHLLAIVDQFDNMNFPREGYFALVDYRGYREALGSDADYDHLVGFLGLAGTRGKSTLLTMARVYSALGSDSPEIYDMGGLFDLSGVPAGSVTGQYGGNVAVVLLHHIADLPIGVGNGVYIGGSVEAGNLWAEAGEASFSDLIFSASAVVGADTIFGPVYLALGISDTGDDALYFYVGRTF